MKFFNWKIIALFGMGIICAVVFIEMFIPPNPAVPTLPDELLLQSQAMRSNAEIESRWQKRLDRSNNSLANRDASLAAVTGEALAEGAYGAACGAVNLVNDKTLADKLLTAIILKASADCKDLPWAAIAFASLDKKQESLASGIQAKWRQCRQME